MSNVLRIRRRRPNFVGSAVTREQRAQGVIYEAAWRLEEEGYSEEEIECALRWRIKTKPEPWR